MMANLELKDMFEKERFPKSNWEFLSLVCYSPLGLIATVLRFFIGLNACVTVLVLTHTPKIRSFVLRMLCLVLGISIKEENKEKQDKSARVLIANCVTPFDHVAIHLATDSVTPSKWGQTFFNSLIPGLLTVKESVSTVVHLKALVEKGEAPILIHPEGTTSGKRGLLKFNPLPSQIVRKVQPIAVTVERPSWANTSPTVLGASAGNDLFWFFFSPYTAFRIRYLDVIVQEMDESPESFINRMEKAISKSLGLPVTQFTASDKAEYEKRYIDELHRPMMPPGASPITQMRNPELVRMVLQVAEVLPHVPHEAIFKDLSRTRSVETTISNILEGAVPFTPVPQTSSQLSGSGSGPCSLNQSALSSREGPSSSKSSADRVLSFAERKSKMIQEARRRYIEKRPELHHLL